VVLEAVLEVALVVLHVVVLEAVLDAVSVVALGGHFLGVGSMNRNF